jgi:beta-lactamase superfamily II metal-dependent hydrolase
LNDVVRNFTVHGALVARAPANDPEFAKFSETLAVTGTRVVRIQAGDLMRFGDVEIEVLWPRAEVSEFSRNNDSTVLRVGFFSRSMLLTGDIEKGGERALVAGGRDLKSETGRGLEVDVVKVPHHGSKSSSTAPFVAATGAKVAVISVGKSSLFGHPHREVVERWEASGAQVLTTGECGTITVATDVTKLIVTGRHALLVRYACS